MKIVIEIDEARFADIQRIASVQTERRTETVEQIIAKGVILPKGHGDLKDMGNLKYVFDLTRDDPIYSGKEIEQAVKSMKTIIPKDTEESE